MIDLLRALAALSEPPASAHVPLSEALELPALPSASDYTELFLLQLVPYASVYLGAEGMIGGEACDRVAGFWRALGLTPPSEPDHLSALLGLYASLTEAERAEPGGPRRLALRRTRKALLWEHLLSWLPAYLAKATEIGSFAYWRWTRILSAVLESEMDELGAQERLPLHLRAAPPLSDPEEEGGSAFLDSLLAPVRSGMILARADLARASRDLGLGLRLGERRYALLALMSQDPAATLQWLSEEAEHWRQRHAGSEGLLGGIARHWRDRAGATATILSQMAHTLPERGVRAG
jgi:TorA maturation chaperone TorD